MKKITIAASALALAVSLPVAAQALDLGLSADVSVGANVGADAGAGNGSAGGSAGGSADATVASSESATPPPAVNRLLSALGPSQATVDAVANIGANSKVTVQDVSALAANAGAFANASAGNSAALAALHAAINANAGFKAQLAAAKIDPDAVVAADVAADGTITLFTNG